MNKKIIQKDIKITGYIRALERDKSGHVFAVFIETENFQKFIVHDGFTKDLVKYLNQKVEVTCMVVNIDVDQNHIIEVIKYKIMDDNKIL